MACKNLHIVNSITPASATSTAALGFTTAVSAVNDKQKFCIMIPCSITIPSGIDAYTVTVTIGGAAVPLLNKYGNPATVSDLVKGRIIGGYYGASTTAHVISGKIPVVCNCSCNNIV